MTLCRCVYTLVPWNLIKSKARLGFNDWLANHKNIGRNQHCYVTRLTNLRICHVCYMIAKKGMEMASSALCRNQPRQIRN